MGINSTYSVYIEIMRTIAQYPVPAEARERPGQNRVRRFPTWPMRAASRDLYIEPRMQTLCPLSPGLYLTRLELSAGEAAQAGRAEFPYRQFIRESPV